jgi:accessory colonization factor AcfC
MKNMVSLQNKNNMKKLVCLVAVATMPLAGIAQTDTVYVYGPDGPFAPINECAQIFSKQNNLVVKVTAGPEANWIDAVTKNTDVIYGRAEYMLTSFAMKHPGLVDSTTRTELYKRGAAILVRPGNPKQIKSLEDLSRPGIKILDANGAGQFGLWEDIAGKEDGIAGIQRNIKQSFANTALGIEGWKSDRSFDAWITYASWHYRLKDITQLLTINESINVYRGTPVAITTISKHMDVAKRFIRFLLSERGHAVFKNWGWQ